MSKPVQTVGKLSDGLNNEIINQPINFQYKKITNNYNNNSSQNDLPSHLNSNSANQLLDNLNEHNYAQHLFNETDNSKLLHNNENISINKNMNIYANNNLPNENDSNIVFPKKINSNIKYITINDIIGDKCEINLDILRLFFNNFEPSKTSRKNMGVVKSYGVNTYQGIVRNYNEDRVSIIINMNKPKDYTKGRWPKTSFFGIYDGHGGEGCSEYLRDNLHKLICNNDYFPENIPEAIKFGISKAEQEFINNFALSENKEEIIDKSGSCAIIILIVDTNIYIANVGDSRCLLSMNDGHNYVEVTKDHKPNSPNEIIRIKKNGGSIYQSQTVINNTDNNDLNGKILIGPYRVLPGRLSVCRTIGDAESKLIKFGGNPNVIICEPEIFYYDLKKENIDFFILGCDGIYDQMTNEEILDCAWMVLNEKEHVLVKECNNIHNQSGLIVDLILKSSLARKSFDNVTCLFISLKDLGKKPSEHNKNSSNNLPVTTGANNQSNIPTNLQVERTEVSEEHSKKKNYEKVPFKRKNILSKDDINNFANEETKCKTNRNNKNFQLLNHRFGNNYNNKSFNTDFKLKKLKLINDMENKNNGLNNNQNLSMKDFGFDKNNNYHKINAKHHLQKINNENNTNSRFSHNRLNTNSIAYSKKNQSFTKINNYLMNLNNNNNYKTKKNSNFNYNILNNKKVSEGNINNKQNIDIDKIFDKSNLDNSNNIINNNRIPKFNVNQPLRIIDSKNSFTNSTKNLNLVNKSSMILNNLNNLNKNMNQANNKSHRYLLSNKDVNRNTDYLALNNSNKINNTQNEIGMNEQLRKNFINLNEQYRYNSQLMNNTRNNDISSVQNFNQKKVKKHLSLNNGENNNALLTNNYIMNKNPTNVYSSRIKKDITSKLRQISMQKSLPNTNFRLNHQNHGGNTTHNLSMQGMHFQNNIYNYGDKTQKVNKGMDKNYQNLTYKAHNKNNSLKYNNYLMTEFGRIKKENMYEEDNKISSNNI